MTTLDSGLATLIASVDEIADFISRQLVGLHMLTPSACASPSEPDLSVRLGGLALANPVMPASGCFGPELAQLIALDRLGAVVTKTVFQEVRSGNPAHRLAEGPGVMLNSVGIPSPGISAFRSTVLPRYRSLGVPVIVSVGGLSPREYWDVVESLGEEAIDAFEVNVSCPNLEKGGLEIGTDPVEVESVTAGVVERTAAPVIVKLTPNVASLNEIAMAAEAGGASAVTVANTFVGIQIDLTSRRAVLGNVIGGVSGPGIKSISLRLVHDVAQAVSIPVIGCGGITCASDALEFIVAGATAVQVGTATFARPDTMTSIILELPKMLRHLGETAISELRNSLEIAS